MDAELLAELAYDDTADTRSFYDLIGRPDLNLEAKALQESRMKTPERHLALVL